MVVVPLTVRPKPRLVPLPGGLWMCGAPSNTVKPNGSRELVPPVTVAAHWAEAFQLLERVVAIGGARA